VVGDYSRSAAEAWKKVMAKYLIEDATVKTVYSRGFWRRSTLQETESASPPPL